MMREALLISFVLTRPCGTQQQQQQCEQNRREQQQSAGSDSTAAASLTVQASQLRAAASQRDSWAGSVANAPLPTGERGVDAPQLLLASVSRCSCYHSEAVRCGEEEPGYSE
jgi:hypothetical protein